MNIEQFRARVAESAAAAQKAARHLSSLDEMAEMDKYVQSPHMNVKPRRRNNGDGTGPSSSSLADSHNNSSEIPAVVEDLSNRFVDVISKAARPSPSRAGLSAASSSKPITSSKIKSSNNIEPTTKKRELLQSTNSTLMPSVAAVYEQNDRRSERQKSMQSQSKNKQPIPANITAPINEKHALILQQLDYDSDSDSSDSSDASSKANESQQQHALHQELEYESNDGVSHQEFSSNNEMKNSKDKDPHRFMKMTEELESEREALITDTNKHASVGETHANNSANNIFLGNNALKSGSARVETNKALKAGLSWVQKVASPQLNAISQHIMMKVSESSRTDNSQDSNESGPMIPSRSRPRHIESDEENITMTSSSNFLSADEMAEFEQMRSKTSQSSILAMILSLVETIKSNHRMAFVAVTLILSVFAYYYSRKRSVDDVL